MDACQVQVNVHDDCSGFGFVFNLAHKDKTAKVIISLEKFNREQNFKSESTP